MHFICHAYSNDGMFYNNLHIKKGNICKMQVFIKRYIFNQVYCISRPQKVIKIATETYFSIEKLKLFSIY